MPERPPDPFRPGEVETGRPFLGIGRPGVAALVVGAIVAAIIALIVIFALT